MRQKGVGACHRELGARLRELRKAAGLTGRELASRIGWSEAKVSRIETGMTEISMVDLIHYMAFCGVLYDHAQELLVEYREAERSRGYWLSPHGALLEDSLCSLIYHESTAAESISYEPRVVPGLLQTEAYARAMIGRDQWRTADNVESCVRARLERQQILHRRRARFTFYLHEHVLHTMVGSAAIMQEQLLALALHAGPSRVAIRVVPASAGVQAVFGGAFRLLQFAKHEPLVHLDVYVGGLFLEDADHVEAYRRLVPAIADVALSDAHSRELFASLANEHDRERARYDTLYRLAEEQL